MKFLNTLVRFFALLCAKEDSGGCFIHGAVVGSSERPFCYLRFWPNFQVQGYFGCPGLHLFSLYILFANLVFDMPPACGIGLTSCKLHVYC